MEKDKTGGRVLQGGVGADPRKAVKNVEETSDSGRSSALSFLSGGMCDGGRYGPQTGEIVGIMKQLIDEMTPICVLLRRRSWIRRPIIGLS